MMEKNTILIVFGILALCVHSSVQQQLKPFQLRFKISKLQCAPLKGYGPDEIKPCYDFKTKKLVTLSQCNLVKNKHCCIYNCACIIKGAGNPKGDIPKIHTLPVKRLAYYKRNAHLPRFRKKGCKVQRPKTTTTPAEETTIATTPITMKSTKKPITKTPKTRTATRKPNKRTKPTPKPTKKPHRTTKPRTTSTPCTKTTTKPFTFNFFSRFSQVLNGFGFQTKVVKKSPC